MRALIACEESGTVREAFTAKGWDALSCDLLPSRRPGKHHQGDIRDVLDQGWDLMIAFPPCTDLASSGARWFTEKRADGRQQAAVEFARMLLEDTGIPHVAMENPVGVLSTQLRKPDQIIQPWQFGHGETKGTCLWLRELPPLVPTNIVPGREARVHRMAPGPNRARERSVTFQGIADAMAEQWTRALTARAMLWPLPCATCRAPMVAAATGRPKKFCSTRCRVAGHRAASR